MSVCVHACNHKRNSWCTIWCKEAKKSLLFWKLKRNWPRYSKRYIKRTAGIASKQRKNSEFLVPLEYWISHGFWPLFAFSHVTQDFRQLQKKIQITVKVWWQVSLEGQAAGKIVMQFSKTFSNGIKTEEERLKGHAQWPIFVNRSNRCSSKVAGLGLEKTSQPIWKTQFIIFTGLFFTQKIWRILTAFFQR